MIYECEDITRTIDDHIDDFRHSSQLKFEKLN